MKKLFIPILMAVIIPLCSCSQSNNSQPEYVKKVVAYKAGSDGLIIYFVLADASGRITTSNGKLTLTIVETDYKWSKRLSKRIESEEKLYSSSFDVIYPDFEKAIIGEGADEREVTLYSFERIAYSSLKKIHLEILERLKLNLNYQMVKF